MIAVLMYMEEGSFFLGTFHSEQMPVLNRSRQDDRHRVMLVLVHMDITQPHTPLPVFRRIGERMIPYSWRAFCKDRSCYYCAEFHGVIVEVEIVGVAIYRLFGEFRRAKSYCHLYGAQGQRQAYLLPHATMNFGVSI
ncbi:uncharacterized protein TNCV_2441441 [Trichonephila clavipes]|nr:uncharacterized protein TNCV_2441441 [Trichonephila clavipes]